jgi:hypothetical protein
MSGHGWVYPNKDGSVARCGGPGLCMECSLEADQKKLEDLGAFDDPTPKHKPSDPAGAGEKCPECKRNADAKQAQGRAIRDAFEPTPQAAQGTTLCEHYVPTDRRCFECYPAISRAAQDGGSVEVRDAFSVERPGEAIHYEYRRGWNDRAAWAKAEAAQELQSHHKAGESGEIVTAQDAFAQAHTSGVTRHFPPEYRDVWNEGYARAKAEAAGELVREYRRGFDDASKLDAERIATLEERAGRAREILERTDFCTSCQCTFCRKCVNESIALLAGSGVEKGKQGTTVCQHGTPTDRACDFCLLDFHTEKGSEHG